MPTIATNDMQKLLIQEHNFKDGVFAAAHALKTIQEHRLYKAKGYSNFENYCIDEMQIKKAQAYRIISAAKDGNPDHAGELYTTLEQEIQYFMSAFSEFIGGAGK